MFESNSHKEERLRRRAEATRVRDEKFKAINEKLAADQVVVKAAKILNREDLRAALEANTKAYRSRIAAINEKPTEE